MSFRGLAAAASAGPFTPRLASLIDCRRTPRRLGGFDNHNPRQWLAGLQGWQARANAAQQNSFEALPIFIAGVLIAERAQPALQARIDLLALLFIAARVGYIAAYVADRASLRSVFWAVGLGASIALFFMG